MRAHEMQLPEGGNSRDRIPAIQELFLKLNNQDEAGIIATYQTAKSILSGMEHDYGNYTEYRHLVEVTDAAKARMLALLVASSDEIERRRLTDVFRAVLDEPWFAQELWNRWESEKRAEAWKRFRGKIFSFFKKQTP